MEKRTQTQHYTERDARRNLQSYLRQLSYTDTSIPQLPVDGIEGDMTTEAISSFQKSHGLPVTGSADQQTWESIYDSFLSSRSKSLDPQPFCPFPTVPVNYAVSKGDNGYLVRTIQHILRELSLIFPSFENVEETGDYDEKTADTISELQAITLNGQTGKTDRETWNTLVSLYDTLTLYIEP